MGMFQQGSPWMQLGYGLPGGQTGMQPSFSSPMSGFSGITAPDLSTIPTGSVMTAPTVTSGMGGGGGGLFAGASSFDKVNMGLSGLQTLGNLWGAFQAAKLAKQQFKFTKDVTNTNLENSMKSYNTALTDRANNRAIVEGRSAAQTQSYIDANSLRRYGR